MTGTQAGEAVLWFKVQVNDKWVMVFTPEEAADCLNLSVGYVRQLCDMGKLLATKINGRWWVHRQRYKKGYVDIFPF